MIWTLALAACAGAPTTSTPPEPGFDHEHAAFAEVLQGAVTAEGKVRYDLLRTRSSALDAYIGELSKADPGSMSRPQKLAFWVNAYNAVTLDLIVDNPGISSIKELDGGEVWKTRSFTIGGETLTLDQIEKSRALPLSDGRVHAVVNCASIGCPPLPPRPLTPGGLEGQLDAAARRWVATNAWEQEGPTVRLSPIFKWYAGDFEQWRKDAIPGANEAQTRALWFIAAFEPEKAQRQRLTAGAFELAWAEYDWGLNDAD